jgi:hypothetical protein
MGTLTSELCSDVYEVLLRCFWYWTDFEQFSVIKICSLILKFEIGRRLWSYAYDVMYVSEKRSLCLHLKVNIDNPSPIEQRSGLLDVLPPKFCTLLSPYSHAIMPHWWFVVLIMFGCSSLQITKMLNNFQFIEIHQLKCNRSHINLHINTLKCYLHGVLPLIN